MFDEECVIPETLVRIDCSHNNIENLCIKSLNLPNLIKLNCSYNKIFNLENLNLQTPNLVELNCSYNKISNLENLPSNLINLNCEKNQLNFIDFPDNIEIVNLDKNKISGMLKFKSKMKIVSANRNMIISFDWENIPSSLEKLYLNHNLIETLEKKKYESDDEERKIIFKTSSYIEIKNNKGIKDNDKILIFGYVIYESSDF